MKSKMTTALLAATLVGGGIVGAGALANAQYDGGGSDDAPTDTLVESPAEETGDAVDQPEAPRTNALQQVPNDEPDADDREGRRGGCNSEVASILGLTNTELRDERAAGSSLASIAADQGVDVQALVDAMIEDKVERIAEKVAAGELSEEEAAEKLARAEERAQQRAENTPGDDDVDNGANG
ncbi:MAG: hypothetical protein AAGF73_03230 [Actinomycetota bacterium]